MSPHHIHIARRGSDVVVDGDHRFVVHHDARTEAPDGDGIFARWHWDGERLVVTNCRYGIYPVYYWATDDNVSVATSLQSILAAGASTQLDDAAIAFFLRAGHFPGDDTPFDAIRLLPPAGRLEWTKNGRWRVSGGPGRLRPQPLDQRAAIDAFVETFRAAVRRRPPRGESVVPLSGGRDSRHTLLELCSAGYRPRFCVTIRHFPPRMDEDARVAAHLADVLDIEHQVLDQNPSQVDAELRKNRLTDSCTDWQAPFMVLADWLRHRHVSDVYAGYGGDTLARGQPIAERRAELWQAGDLGELATFMQNKRPHREVALRMLLGPEAFRRFSRERAHQRLVEELQQHVDQPNPEMAFAFFNALRRRTTPQWFPLCEEHANIYTPYLDPAVYELLASLPLMPFFDADFHTQVIHRAFPQYKDIPFCDPMLERGNNDPAYFRRFATELTRYALSRNASQIVDISQFVARLSGCRHSGRPAIEWLAPGRMLCLLQLEEMVDAVSLAHVARI
jgi:asparagine synthase (glutamine-hydrolysing)